MEKLEIKLGDRTFRVRPLTLGQLRELGIGSANSTSQMAAAKTGEREALVWDRWIEIILLGIGPEHPDVTRDNLLATHMTTKGLVDAVNEILEFAGIEMKEKGAGEALAAASSGETFTGA